MSLPLVKDVFVPGRLPDYTYNPRTSAALESSLDELIDDGGSIICVSGLTKMGKTVLVERLKPQEENVRIDGSQFENVDDFWLAIGDKLEIYPNVTVSTTAGTNGSITAGANLTLAGVGGLASNGTLGENAARQDTYGAARPVSAVALDALIKSGKTLVIDDFHFINRTLQRAVVRGLKNSVFRGLTVIVISTSHRTLDVILAEPNMEGRAEPLRVLPWETDELQFIAGRGFATLNLFDRNGEIGLKLAENAFGSPHLMQKFCKRICRDNAITEKRDAPTRLEPPSDWDEFFRSQIAGASARWFERLVRGPQERGTTRNKWERIKGGRADNYALVMEAIATADDGFEIKKDRIKDVIDSLTAGDGPAVDKSTRALQRISKIAGRPLEDTLPSDEEVDEVAQGETQFVLEFIEEGPNSKAHITDPFFAYYLRWGALERIQQLVDNDQQVP